MAGTLFVVATPIGNLEDITAGRCGCLREVALIAAEDTRRTAHLLARYAITTPTTSLHEHNEQRKSCQRSIARLEPGDSIALVSDAGTPTSPILAGASFGEAVRRDPVEAIPGPNAAIAALSVSGLVADGFLFLGFPPTVKRPKKMDGPPQHGRWRGGLL